MSNRLYRSRTNQMIAGVCGGLGKYLKIDASLVRVGFVLLALATGVGLAAYLILWIIIPYAPAEGEETTTASSGAEELSERVRSVSAEVRGAMSERDPKTLITIGGLLILLGVISLAGSLGLRWPQMFDLSNWWPLLLILAGAVMLWRRTRNS